MTAPIETRGGDDFSRDGVVADIPVLVCSACGARSCWHSAALTVVRELPDDGQIHD